MPVGTSGKIGYLTLPDGRQMARCKFRDYDGKVRPVSRVGNTKTAARHNLQMALRDRQGVTSATSEAKLAVFADAWLQTVVESDKATGTKQTYRQTLNAYIKPGLGDVRLRELTVPIIDIALAAVRVNNGPGSARSTRKVLSLILAHAIRQGAIEANPVREATPIGGSKKRVRALTPDQADEISDSARSDQWAVDHDLPDLIDWMLGTGCRIGEACAAREGLTLDGDPILDLDAGTWEINATVIRETGRGLIIQERPKTAAGWRVLALPPFAVAMVRRRQDELRLHGAHGVVFPSPGSRSLRDPSNTPGDLRKFLDRAGYPWVTSHVFRKTVATRLEEAGLTPRQVADQLGHANPSMTLDVYFGRNVVNAAAAKVLER